VWEVLHFRFISTVHVIFPFLDRHFLLCGHQFYNQEKVQRIDGEQNWPIFLSFLQHLKPFYWYNVVIKQVSGEKIKWVGTVKTSMPNEEENYALSPLLYLLVYAKGSCRKCMGLFMTNSIDKFLPWQ